MSPTTHPSPRHCPNSPAPTAQPIQSRASPQFPSANDTFQPYASPQLPSANGATHPSLGHRPRSLARPISQALKGRTNSFERCAIPTARCPAATSRYPIPPARYFLTTTRSPSTPARYFMKKYLAPIPPLPPSGPTRPFTASQTTKSASGVPPSSSSSAGDSPLLPSTINYQLSTIFIQRSVTSLNVGQQPRKLP